jgi:hypothetical protein
MFLFTSASKSLRSYRHGRSKGFPLGCIWCHDRLFIGLLIGVAIAVWGAGRGIDKSWLHVVSFLTLCSFIVFFILPREQYYFWRKIKRDVLNQGGRLFDFAPVSFFLGVGIGIGVRHGCTQFVVC